MNKVRAKTLDRGRSRPLLMVTVLFVVLAMLVWSGVAGAQTNNREVPQESPAR